MGHDPWVVWVMGHVFDGSHGSWVTLYDPFAALYYTLKKFREKGSTTNAPKGGRGKPRCACKKHLISQKKNRIKG